MQTQNSNKNWLMLTRKSKTHYFPETDANKLIDNETMLQRRAAFQIGYDTGARAGEVIKIKAQDFDNEKQQMNLWDSKKKGWKVIPLNTKTFVVVKQYINASRTSTGKLFPVTTKTLNNWLVIACEREGITADSGTRIRWHSWRGTFVRQHKHLGDKWLLQAIGDSYNTLLTYYEELTEEDMRKAKHGL